MSNKQYKISRLVRLEYETLATSPADAIAESEQAFNDMLARTDWCENTNAKVGQPTLYVEDTNGVYRETKAS